MCLLANSKILHHANTTQLRSIPIGHKTNLHHNKLKSLPIDMRLGLSGKALTLLLLHQCSSNVIAKDAIRNTNVRSVVASTMKQSAEEAVLHLMKNTEDKDDLIAPATNIASLAVPELSAVETVKRDLHNYAR